MAHVDALSKDPISDEEGETLDEVLAGQLDVCITLETDDKMRMAQQVDDEVRRMVTIMLKPVSNRTKPNKHWLKITISGASYFIERIRTNNFL